MATYKFVTSEEVKISNTDNVKEHFETVNNSKTVTLISEFPELCKKEECFLGVDEAGRGPVLGPMVYGICFCPISNEDDLKTLGCADSKILTDEKRRKIFKNLCDEKKSNIGWAVEVISPNTICNSMLRRQKRSLNEVSHDSAIGLIKKALDSGINVTEVYVDTVGPAEKYQTKLLEIFPQLKITVASKADATYPIVSAASICAKVIRDLALEMWTFPEEIDLGEDKNWGSGYPNDPVTKKFLMENIDPVFGFPRLVRFSWSTASKILEENAIDVEWLLNGSKCERASLCQMLQMIEERSDEEDEDSKVTNNTSITTFFKKDFSKQPNGKNIANKKHTFFVDRNLTTTVSLDS